MWRQVSSRVRTGVLWLFGGSLTSKILGLAREVVFAAAFGTGAAAAAFRVAQTASAAPMQALSSDSVTSAFVPSYKSRLELSPEDGRLLLNVVLGLLGVVSLAVVAVLVYFSGLWVSVLGPGLDEGASSLGAHMLCITAWAIPLYILSSIFVLAEISRGVFVLAASRAPVQNLGILCGILASVLLDSAVFLAWGVLAAQILFFVWCAVRLEYRPSWPVRDVRRSIELRAALLSLWQSVRPLLLIPVVLQGMVMVERATASLIDVTAVSAVDYSRFITDTGVLLFSVPLALAGLSAWSGSDSTRVRKLMETTAQLQLLVAVPLSMFLAIQSTLVVEILYARGAFDETSTRSTAAILTGSSVGLWAHMLAYVLLRGLSAQERNRAALVCVILGAAASAATNVFTYTHLGPLALGLGSAAYGLVLFACTATFTQIWTSLRSSLLWLGLGAAGYCFLSSHARISTGSSVTALAVAATFALMYWAAWIAAIPVLRRSALLGWSKFRRRG